MSILHKLDKICYISRNTTFPINYKYKSYYDNYLYILGVFPGRLL